MDHEAEPIPGEEPFLDFEEIWPEDEDLGDIGERIEDENDGWNTLWHIIVHRAAPVLDAPPPAYPPGFWTLDRKNSPFPFNLEAVWYCTAIIVLVLVLIRGIEETWLFRHGYLHYYMRILSRIFITVAASVFSTLWFEVFGNVHQLLRENITERILFAVDVRLIERLGWGPVNGQGRAIRDADGFFLFHRDPAYIQLAREFSGSIMIAIFDYVTVVAGSLVYYFASTAASYALVSIVVFVFPGLGSYISDMSAAITIPKPDPEAGMSPRDIFWEFGPPAYFQVWIAAFLYLGVFLFMTRSERPVILGRRTLDPFSKLVFHLLRATCMHLLAYTAYQIVWICVVIMETSPTAKVIYGFLRNFHFANDYQYIMVTALLLMIAHWLVKTFCKLFVRLSWRFWVPYIVWLSIKTKRGILVNWGVYRRFMEDDFEIFNPGNRVTTRLVMTLVCGLRSSWPTRMKLSTVEGID
ncbi:hypothetical protein AAE478_003214 [Parahypoxylon ruwenzoriense]